MLFLVLVPVFFYGQRHGVFLGGGTELTVSGPFGAAYAGVELNRHMVGFIYAKKINESDNKYSPPYHFGGMLYQFTFLREKNVMLGGMFRAGFVDSEFLVYIPSLVIDYIFSDYFKISVYVGGRGQNPAIGYNMFVNIPFKKHEFPNPVKISFKKKNKK